MDDDGFRAFAHSRLAYLSRVAYLLTGDHHAAEDLLQNALVRLATAWPRVAAAGDPVAYARRVLYNEHVSTWRRGRHLRAERPTADLPDVGGRHDEADDAVRRMMLEHALRRLTHKQRAVIVLRFFEDLTPEDAAEVLGCSPGTVKSQTHHALRRMRELSPELASLVNEMPEALV